MYCIDLKMHAVIELLALFGVAGVRTAVAVVDAAYAVVVVVVEHAAAAADVEVGDHEGSRLGGSAHPRWILYEGEGGGCIVVVFVDGRKAVLDGVVLEAANDQDGIFVKTVIELDPFRRHHCNHWEQEKMACWRRYSS